MYSMSLGYFLCSRLIKLSIVIKSPELDFYRLLTFGVINAEQMGSESSKRRMEIEMVLVVVVCVCILPQQSGLGWMVFCDGEGLQPAMLKLHQWLGKLSFSEPVALLNQTLWLVDLGNFPVHTSLTRQNTASAANNLRPHVFLSSKLIVNLLWRFPNTQQLLTSQGEKPCKPSADRLREKTQQNLKPALFEVMLFPQGLGTAKCRAVNEGSLGYLQVNWGVLYKYCFWLMKEKKFCSPNWCYEVDCIKAAEFKSFDWEILDLLCLAETCGVKTLHKKRTLLLHLQNDVYFFCNQVPHRWE